MSITLKDKNGRAKSQDFASNMMSSYITPELVKNLTGIINDGSGIRDVCDSFTTELEKSDWVDWARVFLTADEKTIGNNRQPSPLDNAPRHDIFVRAVAVVENAPSRNTCRQLGCPAGTAAIIWLPLLVGADVVGAMVVTNPDARSGSRKQLPALQYLAGILSLGIQVKTLQQEKQKALRQDAEWINFVNLLVHELKTSLTTVVSSAGLLQEKTAKRADEMQKRIVQNLGESLNHMEAIVSELPTLIRAQRQPVPAPADFGNAGLVLREALAHTRPAADRRGQFLVLDAPESLPAVAMGQTRLKQVLLHLLANAIESTPEKGEIILKAQAVDDTIVIEVSDSGPAIPEERHHELFEPAAWGAVDSQWVPRLRFRIAVSKILIEACYGRLWLENRPGQGNTFAFSLPVAAISSTNNTAGNNKEAS